MRLIENELWTPSKDFTDYAEIDLRKDFTLRFYQTSPDFPKVKYCNIGDNIPRVKCNRCCLAIPESDITYMYILPRKTKKKEKQIVKNPFFNIPTYIYHSGTQIIEQHDAVCLLCISWLIQNIRDIIYKQDWDEEERLHCKRVRLNRFLENTHKRLQLRGIDLPNVQQNTSNWMRHRFGPTLKRVGASRAGGILCVSPYGGASHLFDMIMGANNIKRCENSAKSDATEFGHHYEDFVRRIVMILLDEYIIIEGGIRIPYQEKDRLRYAVSVDGNIYNKKKLAAVFHERGDNLDDYTSDKDTKKLEDYVNNLSDEEILSAYVGGFEAKCAYHRDHAQQAREEHKPKKKFENPNASDGIKAEHMAQIQMQMGVTISADNKKDAPDGFTIYCTVKWNRFYPPCPKWGIPPFEDVTILKVPFDKDYWFDYEKVKLDEFTDALNGKAPRPTLNILPTDPPHVKNVENLIATGTKAQARLTRLRGEMLFWKTANDRQALAREKEITSCRRKQEENGEEVVYDTWW